VSAFGEGGRFPDASTLVVAATLTALPFVLPSVSLASELVVFAVGALSCVQLLGLAGLLSFGQGLFFGIGAYASGVLLSGNNFGMLAAVAVGACAAGLVAALLAQFTVRRHGVYFVMLTLAFAQMGYFAMLALKDVTGGENGLSGVTRPPLVAGFGTVATPGLLYALLALLAFGAYILVQRVGCSPFGSVLRAIRQNEVRAEALGYNVGRFKLAAFVLAGLIAGLGGAMQTLFLGFVPPSSIDLEMSERLLVMAIIGGVGAPAGALVGAGFYVLMADWLSTLWPRWPMLIGLLIIAIVLFLRGGLWGGAAQLAARLGRGRRHG
jgi:branched-chain amino acid transport system permease protein